MEKCDLHYISPDLHTDEKPTISEFFVGDVLFRRCKEAELRNPYLAISIAELSHNLGIVNGNIISRETDVLLSIRADEPFEIYPDKVPCRLEIKSLNPENNYSKPYTQIKDKVEYTAVLELVHEPESCMYPHCVFRVTLNGVVITTRTYNDTIKKLPEIKTKLKEEIASMVIQKEINQDSNITDV